MIDALEKFKRAKLNSKKNPPWSLLLLKFPQPIQLASFVELEPETDWNHQQLQINLPLLLEDLYREVIFGVR